MQPPIKQQQYCQHCDQEQWRNISPTNQQKHVKRNELKSIENGLEFSSYSQGGSDQSTQAMTEVALALSMAFFSLFLLALISMGASKENSQGEPTSKDTETFPELVLVQSKKSELSSLPEPLNGTEKQFVFFYNGALYDQKNQLTTSEALDLNKKLIVAMPIDTDVSKALSLQKDFAKFDVALTVMNDEWLSVFESSL